MCTSSSPKPKGSPEYQKDYKPENNAGCCSCGGCRRQPATSKKRIKRGCHIRYRIIS